MEGYLTPLLQRIELLEKSNQLYISWGTWIIGILTLLLAIAVAIQYFYLEHSIKKSVCEQTKEDVRKIAEDETNKYIQTNLYDILLAHKDLVKDCETIRESANNGTGDQISEQLDGD